MSARDHQSVIPGDGQSPATRDLSQSPAHPQKDKAHRDPGSPASLRLSDVRDDVLGKAFD